MYNTGWNCRITYGEAAAGFETTIERWKVKYQRIRAMWWYQIADQREPMAVKRMVWASTTTGSFRTLRAVAPRTHSRK